MLARGTALRFPVFSFEFRLVLTHRPCPPTSNGAMLVVLTVRIEGEIHPNGSGLYDCAYVFARSGEGGLSFESCPTWAFDCSVWHCWQRMLRRYTTGR